MTQPRQLLHRVGDAWVGDGDPIDDLNPARRGEVVARARLGGKPVAAAAAAAARAALPAWSRTPAPARGEILFRAAEILASRAEAIGADLTREEGKTLAEGIGEARRAAAIFRYAAGRTLEPIGAVYASATPGTRISTLRQPIGVVAAISPWNFPIAIPAWKIAPALAYGNTVLFKPATATPISASRLVEALVDAGLPPGVVNLVFASGSTISDAWIGSGAVDGVSFTGSEAVGRQLQALAAPRGIKVQLELGGKNAVIVDESADIERAADLVVRGAMASAGQKCTATSRVIPVGDSRQPLVERLVERVASLRPGDPLDPDTTLGPVIDGPARERIGSMLDRAQRDGARIAGSSLSSDDGEFVAATVLDDVQPQMAIAREEVFGPVLAILPAPDLAAAIRLHNDVAYGLSGSIFTRDLAAADAFVQAAQVGIVHVNGETAGAEPHVPFGGMKRSSSWSREQGPAAEEFFTQTKTVYVDGLPLIGPWDHA
jgi:alpha-ketoglutaric semialdehyde dehydrogenase